MGNCTSRHRTAAGQQAEDHQVLSLMSQVQPGWRAWGNLRGRHQLLSLLLLLLLQGNPVQPAAAHPATTLLLQGNPVQVATTRPVTTARLLQGTLQPAATHPDTTRAVAHPAATTIAV